MTIGELARAAGVAISTVRFYERRELLVPSQRTSGNYRLYEEVDVDRLRFIRRAQELGFTLADVALLLGFSRGRAVPRAALDRVGRAKMEDLDARIEDLRRVRRGLAALLAQPCIDPTQPCPVINALSPRPLPTRALRGRPKAARGQKPAQM
ncbi:MAG: MerR family transcriptional regulator [Myxococcus sp.]|nr:MerR family transcriptional regulator [Myxococcus sp.]